jgi:hypothetical protein
MRMFTIFASLLAMKLIHSLAPWVATCIILGAFYGDGITVAALTTRPPTSSPAPSFVEVCDICGSPDLSITSPDVTVIINGVSARCGLLSQIADARLVPPGQACNDTVAAVVENCGCLPIESTLDPTLEMTEFPTASPIVVPPLQDCYVNLQDLQTIVRFQDPTLSHTYTLCPNTVFNMGYLNASNVCCVDGYPPMWPRKDTTYQCGDDGSSSNNCILRGGSYQVTSFPFHFSYEEKTGAVFKGITFEQAAEVSVLLVNAGDFTFVDCIFQVRFPVVEHVALDS